MDYLSTWRDRRVLITGGTGFIGRHTSLQGLAAGIDVHTLSRSRTVGGSSDARHHTADLRDGAELSTIVRRIQPDAIIHLAAVGMAGPLTLTAALETNAVGTANLLAAAETLSTWPPIVIAGSGFEYGARATPVPENDPVEPFSPYGVSKAAAALCAGMYASRAPMSVLRLFSVYGIGEKAPRLIPHVIANARRHTPIELTSCEQVRDYTFAADAAETFWRALALSHAEHGLRILNVGTGRAVPLRYLVTTLCEQLRCRGLDPDVRFGALPYRADEPMTYVPDVTRMKETLGWLPPTSLEVGLEKTIDAML